MTVGIYGIFDSITDECLYVGLSSIIEERWAGHLTYLKNGKHLRKNFVIWFEDHNRKVDSMEFRILEECDGNDKVMNLLEIKWFNKLSPKFAGKVPSENEKWRHSDETKQAIAKGMQRYLEAKGVYEYRTCYCGEFFKIAKKTYRKYCSDGCKLSKKLEIRSASLKKALCLQCKINQVAYRKTYCSQKCFGLSKIISIDKDRLFDLYWNQELSLARIAEIENVSRQTIFKKMKKFEISRR